MQHKIKIRGYHLLPYQDDAKRFVGRRCQTCKTGISDGGFVQRAYISDAHFLPGMRSRWLRIPYTEKPKCEDCIDEEFYGPDWGFEGLPILSSLDPDFIEDEEDDDM